MKKFPLIAIAAVIIGMATLIPAHAATIYSQPLNLNGDGGAYSYSNQQLADAFQLSAAASLSNLSWYGDNFANTFPGTVAFTINLYNDNAGLPANSPFSSQAVTASASDTGLSEADCCSALAEIFKFDATLPSSVALSGGTTYWLSILDASGSSNTFRWANGTTTWVGDPGTACCSTSFWNSESGLRAQVAYDLNPAASAVPEPASLLLLGTGIAGIGLAVWRKRK
jgi:hypothetical protein